MTAAEARALFAAPGHRVLSELDEPIPALREIVQG